MKKIMNAISVDFKIKKGLIKKALYGSGYHIPISNRHLADETELFKQMRFPIVRNHDWSHINTNLPVIDVQNIFPLMHLDPADERNYNFGPSDEVIRLVYEAGSKVFYRLGTSIEHTEGIHFNAVPPKDFEKYAEVCAAIVRHYTQGWNNGFHYDMQYWEIWNEPEGTGNMWTGTRELFAEFFAIVLQRLKSEFPNLKIGGPAQNDFWEPLVNLMKAECDKRGVKPDFYSHHTYDNRLEHLEYLATFPREYLDKIGWNDVESCINEWHFIRRWDGVHMNVTPESYKHTTESDDGLFGINSAAFNIAAYCIWQNGAVDSSYYYGCGDNSWGLRCPDKTFNKNYYSLLLFRDMVYDYPNQVALTGGTPTQRALAGLSDDGRKAAILITDLYGADMEIPVNLDGFKQTKASCIVLDSSRNNECIAISPEEDGSFILRKNQPGSTVFMLLLEK